MAVDDASTDNTQELLSQIHDPRFRYVRNDKNLGAQKNWLNSLELGRGEWLYLVMGRDKLLGGNITRLIALLDCSREHNIAFFKDSKLRIGSIRVYNGIDAMIRFIGWSHPTGSIFNRELFTAIPERARYYESADVYPENYVIRDLLLKGNGAVIVSGIITGEHLVDFLKVKSTVFPAEKLYSAFFAPKRLIKRSLDEFTDMIDMEAAGTFSRTERDKYFGSKFCSMLEDVSYRWRYWCANPELMAHYGHSTRKITFSEMLKNILTAYRSAKAHLIERGTYTRRREQMMRIRAAYMAMKTVIKVAIYDPAKMCAKSILKPLGIWGLLQHLKRLLKSPA